MHSESSSAQSRVYWEHSPVKFTSLAQAPGQRTHAWGVVGRRWQRDRWESAPWWETAQDHFPKAVWPIREMAAQATQHWASIHLRCGGMGKVAAPTFLHAVAMMCHHDECWSFCLGNISGWQCLLDLGRDSIKASEAFSCCLWPEGGSKERQHQDSAAGCSKVIVHHNIFHFHNFCFAWLALKLCETVWARRPSCLHDLQHD